MSKTPKKSDSYFMGLALALAEKSAGRTSPNPAVGAVLVNGGEVIGSGRHKKAGMPHAEVEAIVSVKEKKRLQGSTMYVTLEPCCHSSKRSSCTKAVIDAGIGRVVASMKDPNPEVNGHGIEELRRAGLKVETGLRGNEARKLNTAFAKFITTKEPFVVLKAAMSADGKTATRTGQSKWISSAQSRKRVHELRNIVDAVIVGINTVLRDDPKLTCRSPGGRDPLRVVLDSGLRIPVDARVLADGNAIIATTGRCDKRKKNALEEIGVEVLVVGSDGDGVGGNRVNLKEVLGVLAARGLIHIMIEGGSEISASALGQGVVDKVVYFIAPKIIGGRDAKTPVGGAGIGRMSDALRLRDIEVKRIGDDIVMEGYL